MQTLHDEQFRKFKRPKIEITDKCIAFYDPPIFWRFFLTFFWFLLVLLAYGDQDSQRGIGIFVTTLMTCIFGYDSISLKRVKVDLEKKVVFKRSLNPLENLIDRMLKRPSEIAFDSISAIYVDKPAWVAPSVNRYYLYLKTTDPYNLRIAIFANASEAEEFAQYLTWVIKNKHSRSIG